MGQAEISFTVVLTDINCGQCGGTYAINERFRKQREVYGDGWHCPYCQCSWGYFTNSENARLKKEIEDEKKRTQAALARANEAAVRAAQATADAAAADRKLKRHLKRTVAGVCPCCNRTFQQLQRHMKTKHPDFTPS